MNLISQIICYFGYNHLNLLKTLYLNFRCLPLNKALYFPIWVYGNMKIKIGKNCIDIQCEKLRAGIIRLNKTNTAPHPNSGKSVLIVKKGGCIFFKGTARIGCANRLYVDGGTLTLGSCFIANNENRIYCSGNINFGDNVVLSHCVTVSDENDNRHCNIYIGDKCWFGNNSDIIGEVIIPSNTIIASHSKILNATFKEQCTILGGGKEHS